MSGLSPKEARSYKQLLKLAATVKYAKRSWLHLGHDGSIIIVNQVSGNPSTGTVRLSRREFETFVRYYEAKQ